MPLKIITGDIIKQKTDVIVIPAAPRNGPSSKFAKKFYAAAGYDELKKAREKIGRLNDGEAGVTPGFRLNAKYIIHVFTPEWFGGYMEEPKYLAKCYCKAIKAALELNADSISFPLLGAGSNRFPTDVAKKIAVDTIKGYLREHSDSLNVYLVLFHHSAKGSSAPQQSIAPNGFDKSRFIEYMNKNIKSISKFAEQIGCSKSTVARILNGDTVCPQKKTVLLIAAGLGLSKEERYDFINCSGNPYPIDERDYKFEELLDSGCTNIDSLNIALYEQNPGWDLRNKCKGDNIPE